jgi:hypothetical protein
MEPSRNHGIKSRIPQGIEIRMNHLPEEVQEKGQKANTQLWYIKNPLFRNEFLPRMQEKFPKM